MNALTVVFAALCIFAIGYRFYGLFIANKVLNLNDARVTPAVKYSDGHDYVDTNKYVLFGHHFAAIAAAGVNVVSYGAPVLPGAMFLVSYFADGTPVLGLPGCVMYAKATIFDLLLPRIVADVPITRREIKRLGNGGLCLGCGQCHYPICPFGKGD